MPKTKKQMEGEGFLDFVKSINRFLKKNKVISKAANIGSIVGVPYAGTVGAVAKTAGYGKGGALRTAGGALRVPGQKRGRGTKKVVKRKTVKRKPVKRKMKKKV